MLSFTGERDICLCTPAFGRIARGGADGEQSLRNDQGLCGMW